MSALFREINAAEPVRMVDMVAHEEPADADVDKDYSVDADGDVGSEEEMHEVAATTAVVTHSSSNSSSSGCDRERREGGPPQQPDHHQQQQQQPDYQEILTAAADQLALQYAEMFKPSSRCKPPHLNVDVLRDDLYQSGFLARHSPQAATAQQLLDLLERVNQSVKSQMLQEQQQGKEKNVPPPSKSAQAALRKAGEHDFFLGMDKAWMYQTYT